MFWQENQPILLLSNFVTNLHPLSGLKSFKLSKCWQGFSCCVYLIHRCHRYVYQQLINDLSKWTCKHGLDEGLSRQILARYRIIKENSAMNRWSHRSQSSLGKALIEFEKKSWTWFLLLFSIIRKSFVRRARNGF